MPLNSYQRGRRGMLAASLIALAGCATQAAPTTRPPLSTFPVSRPTLPASSPSGSPHSRPTIPPVRSHQYSWDGRRAPYGLVTERSEGGLSYMVVLGRVMSEAPSTRRLSIDFKTNPLGKHVTADFQLHPQYTLVISTTDNKLPYDRSSKSIHAYQFRPNAYVFSYVKPGRSYFFMVPLQILEHVRPSLCKPAAACRWLAPGAKPPGSLAYNRYLFDLLTERPGQDGPKPPRVDVGLIHAIYLLAGS